MKPFVSSFVALAIAVVPLSVMAKPGQHGASHARIEKPSRGGKGLKVEKADRVAKGEKLARVKSGKRGTFKEGTFKEGTFKKAALKNVVHHASNVDLAGAGHAEPKVDRSGVLVKASMTTTHASTDAKVAPAKLSPKEEQAKVAPKGDELPRLPSPTAEPALRGAKVAKKDAATKPPCMKDPVEIIRGPEMDRFELTKCDGTIAPFAIERLSILVRPGAAARPTAALPELAKKTGSEIARGVRRIDPRLVGRIQAIAERFGKPGAPAKLFVISGYRPASVGSMHSSGRAIDFRVEGVRNEEVVTFCKSIGDTGCGFYPNSSFVHMDVRDPGVGHVTWIDASGPGETPRYVPEWPPPPVASRGPLRRASATEPAHELVEEGERLLRARRPLEREAGEEEDLHPASIAEPRVSP